MHRYHYSSGIHFVTDNYDDYKRARDQYNRECGLVLLLIAGAVVLVIWLRGR